MKTFRMKGVKVKLVTGKESNRLTKHKQCYIVGNMKFYSERNVRKFINQAEEIVK